MLDLLRRKFGDSRALSRSKVRRGTIRGLVNTTLLAALVRLVGIQMFFEACQLEKRELRNLGNLIRLGAMLRILMIDWSLRNCFDAGLGPLLPVARPLYRIKLFAFRLEILAPVGEKRFLGSREINDLDEQVARIRFLSQAAFLRCDLSVVPREHALLLLEQLIDRVILWPFGDFGKRLLT